MKNIKNKEEQFIISEFYNTLSSLDDSEFNKAAVAFDRAQADFIERLEYTSIRTVIKYWIRKVMSNKTGYQKCIESMAYILAHRIIPETFAGGQVFTVGGLKHIRHQQVIDYLKNDLNRSEEQRQDAIDCYLNFIEYLNRRSFGWFRIDASVPHQLNPKSVSKALSLTEWHAFLKALNAINHRDALIAQCLLQGARRISSVLNLLVHQVDFENNQINFETNKRNIKVESTVIYSSLFMKKLKKYIENTSNERGKSEYVFVTRNGNPLARSRLNYSFTLASLQAGIKNVTPEVLRSTWVTLTKIFENNFKKEGKDIDKEAFARMLSI